MEKKKSDHLNTNRYQCHILVLSLVSSNSKTGKEFEKFITKCIFKTHFKTHILQFIANTLSVASSWTGQNFAQQQCSEQLCSCNNNINMHLILTAAEKRQLCSLTYRTSEELPFEELWGPLNHTPLDWGAGFLPYWGGFGRLIYAWHPSFLTSNTPLTFLRHTHSGCGKPTDLQYMSASCPSFLFSLRLWPVMSGVAMEQNKEPLLTSHSLQRDLFQALRIWTESKWQVPWKLLPFPHWAHLTEEKLWFLHLSKQHLNWSSTRLSFRLS